MIGAKIVRTATAGLVAAVAITTAVVSACGASSSTATGTPRSNLASPPAITATTPLPTPSSSAPAASSKRPPAPSGAEGVPRFDHIVIVVEENKPFNELGTASTPFLAGLARSAAVLTQSYAITHPSEPNYLALFSGSTQGLSSDSCPDQFTGPNLAVSLTATGNTFTGYSESLPAPGYEGCSAGAYARKHAPWTDFALPAAVNQPMTAFPADFTRLPTVSFVIPNLQNDMHDGSIAEGDRWLAEHLTGYLTWARAHNSLLIVTTDEDDNSHDNHIATILAGAHVTPGEYSARTDHYGLLRTVLDSSHLHPFGAAASTRPLTGMWKQ
jgi:hypothetical protein